MYLTIPFVTEEEINAIDKALETNTHDSIIDLHKTSMFPQALQSMETSRLAKILFTGKFIVVGKDSLN